MAEFKGVSEKFNVSMVPEVGVSQRVICQVRLATYSCSASQVPRCSDATRTLPLILMRGVLRQIGLDGLFLLSLDTQRTLRKFPLQHISRWALRGTNLVLYTRTPVDLEERTITLQADNRTICSVLDTLTCCCMQ